MGLTLLARTLLVIGVAAAAACSSPEASRSRGEPGADPGNRTPVMDIHGKTDQAHKTPARGKAIEMER